MPRIFQVQNTDKRHQLIQAVEQKQLYFRSQKPRGSDVEFFSPDTGFCLLEGSKHLALYSKFMQRVISAAKLSLGPKLELREFYYTLRQTPELIKAFEGVAPETIYPLVLRAINDLEIICDIDRVNFTMGNLSKGFIFDSHSWSFNNPEKKIGFTETIARTLPEYELETSANIIIVEKNAAATRLVELGFSELTNSCIVTVGGNFNRAIWFLTARYLHKKNIIFLCDADVYGDDMIRTIEFGTMNSRHLPFKFPPSKYPNIYFAGLWPSIAEMLGLPNDVSEKRPLNNPYARKRLEFLERYNLMDERDIATWRRNKTYELEALSTAFKSRETQEPIGLALYLIEFMRLKNIPIKPPLPPDEELLRKFREAAFDELRREIREALLSQDEVWSLAGFLEHILTKIINSCVEVIVQKCKEELESTLDKVPVKPL